MLQYRKRDVKTHFFPVQSRPAGRPGQIDGDDVDADVNADDVNADDDEYNGITWGSGNMLPDL